jgi:hypothetical protein
MEQPASPTSCGDYFYGASVQKSAWAVTDCTGGNVTSFYGKSLCSDTVGDYHETGNPSEINGIYCWCQITSVMPFGAVTGPWVYRAGRGYSNVAFCARDCAEFCGDSAGTDGSFRSVLFSGLGV